MKHDFKENCCAKGINCLVIGKQALELSAWRVSGSCLMEKLGGDPRLDIVSAQQMLLLLYLKRERTSHFLTLPLNSFLPHIVASPLPGIFKEPAQVGFFFFPLLKEG